jgi:hypothetical protein
MKNLLFVLLSLAAFTLASCNKEEGTTSMVVRLTDSPGDYEKVNIDLLSVQIHTNTGDQDDGWQTMDSNPGIYDLLTLTNGVESVIADDTYPTGRISQLRLILGDNNSVVVDGIEYPLKVPSGSESGLKVQIHADLVEGIDYSVLIDFDAAKSVVETGASDKYILKPVIKAITEALDGAVKGTVLPAELGVAVYAISGTDTLSTSYAIENNSDFFLGGLADGSYTISFDPGDLSGYQGIVMENVSVTLGEVNDLGETVLIQ